MSRLKRLLLSLVLGFSGPLTLFVTLVFLRAFRAPDWLVEGLISLFLWPFLTKFAVVYCSFFPPPTTWMMLLISAFIDGLICFVVSYLFLLLFFNRRRKVATPLPLLPPI